MFLGNQKAVKLLERQIRSGKIAQAYLFCGPESVGKFTLAKEISRKIISGKDFSLDLIIVEPEIETGKSGVVKEKEIKIEKIKEAQRELSLFPYQGRYKVLIINNAHQMTESAQNALLKILEEPNKTSVIILITHEEDKIISTIRSRCQKIRFNLVPQREIESILSEKKDKKDIAYLSMGRPGMAVDLTNNTAKAESLEDIWQKFKSLHKSGINEKLKIAEEMSRNIPEASNKLKFLLWMMQAQAMKGLETGEALNYIKTAGRISECLDMLKNTGINSRLTLENLLLNL
jgi:DNA polymerase-3 subunit delta'